MKNRYSTRAPARLQVPSRFVGFILLAAAGWFGTSCTLMDLFSGGQEDDQPAATATRTDSASPPSVPTAAVATRLPSAAATRTPTPTATPVPPELRYLRDLADQWADTDTVHFELDVDGKTYLDERETIELRSAKGDLKRPDQTSASAKVNISFASFTVKLIVIGDEAYTTNVLNGDWERAPSSFDFNPALLFSDRRGIGAVLEDLRDPRLAGREVIDGRSTQMLTGRVSEDEIEDLVAGSLTGGMIDVTVWMDTATDQLLRIRLSEPADAEGGSTTWTIDFSDHAEPVTITAPDL